MFESLSEQQRKIVFDLSGKYVVRACPGSGKTFCVSARLNRLILNWKKEYEGIAVLSFTNVAWQEIQKKYTEDFRNEMSIPFPHFLGTIDSFINRYIFLPFGHLILGCSSRPILVGEPHGIWTGRFFNETLFDKISYKIDGSLYSKNPRIMPNNWESNNIFTDEKIRLNKRGFATQSDANYFAMKLLTRYPLIAKSLALRFPYLIIDEAQDTSEIQMRIIDLLIQYGLNEVMLVGDPDQAIFEWNDARPDLLNEKYNQWSNSIILNENRRSSQLICNVTFGISSLSVPSIAINKEVKDYPIIPSVILYDSNLSGIIRSFILECEEQSIPITPEKVAVLFRSKNIFNDIVGVPDRPYNDNPWPEGDDHTKEIAKGKYLIDHGYTRDGFKKIERAIIKKLLNVPCCTDETIQDVIDKIGFISHRNTIYGIICSLPKAEGKIGKWIDAANKELNLIESGIILGLKKGAIEYTFDDLFLPEDMDHNKYPYRIGTVHSVKGETFDAILLILKTKGIGSTYKTLLNGNVSISESEELRIAYVGITRPRKLLRIAVPNIVNKDAWEKRLKINEL